MIVIMVMKIIIVGNNGIDENWGDDYDYDDK